MQTNEAYRLPPQDIDTEESVLAGLMLGEHITDAVEMLVAEDFYKPAHQKIFAAAQAMYQKQIPVDLLTLKSQLESSGTLGEVGGAAYLAKIVNSCPVPSNMARYCEIVKNKAILRQVINRCSTIVGECFNGADKAVDILDRAQQDIMGIRVDDTSGNCSPVADLIDGRLDHYEKIAEQKTGITGVPSGLHKLDRLTSGWQDSDLIILAARPSMGKTALMLQMLRAAARAGVPAGVFSLEMAKQPLVDRQIAQISRVDLQRIRTGALTDDHWREITRAAGLLCDMPIYIDDSTEAHYRQITRRARQMVRKYGVKIIFIDYIGLMSGDNKNNRTQEMGEITRALKAMAKDLCLPVVALSQLNRGVESRNDKRPKMSDLRDSGEIEQDADVVMLLYRDDYYAKDSPVKGIAEIDVAKQRNGPTGVIDVLFRENTASFENLSYQINEDRA